MLRAPFLTCFFFYVVLAWILSTFHKNVHSHQPPCLFLSLPTLIRVCSAAVIQMRQLWLGSPPRHTVLLKLTFLSSWSIDHLGCLESVLLSPSGWHIVLMVPAIQVKTLPFTFCSKYTT